MEIYKIIMSLLHMIISMGFFNTFLNIKVYMKKWDIIIWSVYYIIDYFIIKIIDKPYILLAYNIVTVFFICAIIYKDKYIKTIQITVLYIFIGMMIEILTWTMLLSLKVDSDSMDLYAWTVAKFFFLILFEIIKRISVKSKKKYIAQSKFLLLVPLLSIIILHLFYLVSVEQANNMLYMYIFMLFIFILNMYIFYIVDKIQLKNELIEQNLVLKNQTLANAELMHDIDNHLICINTLLKRNEYQKVTDYVNKLIDRKGNIDFVYTGNSEIDAILNAKINLAKSKNIKINPLIAIPRELKGYDIMDVCIILGNILDNAIEAVGEVKEETKLIYFDFKFVQGNLLLYVINKYDKKRKKDIKGNYYTTKDDVENHGLGLEITKNIISKYDGLLDIKDTGTEFQVGILIYAM